MENNIERFIENYSIKFGGVVLFTPENARKLIDLLVLNNKKIYGVDGIFVLKEGRRPSMDDSINISERYKDNTSLAQLKPELLKFIQSRAHIKDLFFEIVFQG